LTPSPPPADDPTDPDPTDPFSEVVEAVDTLNEAFDQTIEDLPRSKVVVDDIDEEAIVALTYPDSDYRQPWDMRDDESSYEYQLFCAFRDMGLSRVLKNVEEYVYVNIDDFKTKRVPAYPQIYKVSRKHDWKERAASWDQHEEHAYQVARAQSIRAMVTRHEENIVEAISGLMMPIRALALRMENDPNFISSLSGKSVDKLITMANRSARTIPSLMQAERLARGMPTEIVAGTIDHEHTIAVEKDQIGDILAILGQAGVIPDTGPVIDVTEVTDASMVEVYSVPGEGDDRS